MYCAEVLLNTVYEDSEGIEYLALAKALDSETRSCVVVYRPMLSTHERFICAEAGFKDSFAYLRQVSDAETLEFADFYGTPDETSGVVVGGQYVHFKGGHYTVVYLATDVVTGNVMVVYKDQEENIWVRSRDMFLEQVTRNGETFDRFTLVQPTH